MAPPRFLPSDSILAQWVEEGLTHKQMAERVKEQTGVEVAVGTVSAALSRAGLTDQLRYEKWIPWSPIRVDHANAYPLLMLRYYARRESGIQLTAMQEAKLNNWISRLQEEDAVVTYVHDSADGWYYTPRRPGIDNGLIRELS